MKRLLLLIGIAVYLGCVGQTWGEDTKDRELAGLQGTWELVSMEIKGNSIPVERMPGRIALIEGTTFTDRNATKIFGKGKIRVDSSGSPKRIDAEFSEGPPAGKTTLAIYELEKETLKACAAEPGEPRPTKFTTKEGSGHMLVVYKKKRVSP